MTRPIFFDPTGRRGLWARRSLATGLIAILIAALAFATTLIEVPAGSALALPLPHLHAARLVGLSEGHHSLRSWLPHWLGGRRGQVKRKLSIGFYVPDDESSLSSLRRHAGQLDWAVPALVSVTGRTHAVHIVDDPRFDHVIASEAHAPKILPMVQNIGAASWDGDNAARLLANRAASRHLAAQLASFVTQRHAAGLVMDFESLPETATGDYLRFLRLLRTALPSGAHLAVTVPAEEQGWRLRQFAQVSDRVIFMAYDQHWQGGIPGPIAAQSWFAQHVQNALRAIGSEKIVVALGSYGYDWHDGGADALSLDEAWLAAHDSSAAISFDPTSGNSGFAYDEGNKHHQIWMLDAATSWNEMQALKRLGIEGVALWRLGSEDPGFWNDLTAFRTDGLPDLRHLVSMLNTDVEGAGEILRITATPSDGARAVQFDPDGLIRQERYQKLPTPYQVRRTGAQPHMVALTFDDGPDPKWTPKILSILERAHVPATFFVVGENALEHPALLRRIVADGDEIGNHTYSHPNLATASPRQTELELNATQRLVQAYTGRSMRLFRAPYFGDAEPSTADELLPALAAQRAGYTVVGLHVDPNDWQRPRADKIVRDVVQQVEGATPDRSANVILLHDGGGERSQTVVALPRIIASLQAKGYRFGLVSQLAGLSQADAMPPVKAGDLTAVRIDVAIFIALAAASAVIGWLFVVAISLGIGRAVLMAFLAWFQSRRDRSARPRM